MNKSIKISKLDAAKRQLEIAIRMYFSDEEPVSIHTLTAAAYNVVRDINKNRKGQLMLIKDMLIEYTKPEYRKVMRRKINEAEIFFKHAEKYADVTLNFNPNQAEMLIMDACSKYYQLTGEYPPLFKIFQAWYLSNNPKLYNLPEEYKQRIESGGIDVLSMGKKGFFEFMLPIVMKV